MKRKVLKNIDNEEDDILYIVISKIMYSAFGSNPSYSASYCSNKMEYINFNLTAEAFLRVIAQVKWKLTISLILSMLALLKEETVAEIEEEIKTSTTEIKGITSNEKRYKQYASDI